MGRRWVQETAVARRRPRSTAEHPRALESANLANGIVLLVGHQMLTLAKAPAVHGAISRYEQPLVAPQLGQA